MKLVILLVLVTVASITESKREEDVLALEGNRELVVDLESPQNDAPRPVPTRKPTRRPRKKPGRRRSSRPRTRPRKTIARKNPCEKHKCKTGQDCVVNRRGRASCTCAKLCRTVDDPRAMVCSNQNVTYTSECELNRERCNCYRRQKSCPHPKRRAARLDYFGKCKKLTPCPPMEMAIFPLRFRNWLSHILNEMAKRQDLPEVVKKRVIKERKLRDKGQLGQMAVIWQFCVLDNNKNRVLDRQEILRFVAPLKAMEYCISPFIRKCAGRDKKILHNEWGKCMGLNKGHLQEFSGLCKQLASN